MGHGGRGRMKPVLSMLGACKGVASGWEGRDFRPMSADGSSAVRVVARRRGLGDGVGVLRQARALGAVDAARVPALGVRPAGLLRLRPILGRVVGVHAVPRRAG